VAFLLQELIFQNHPIRALINEFTFDSIDHTGMYGIRVGFLSSGDKCTHHADFILYVGGSEEGAALMKTRSQ
jgi:hypothetical protein